VEVNLFVSLGSTFTTSTLSAYPIILQQMLGNVVQRHTN
jgi:hypothetical protein